MKVTHNPLIKMLVRLRMFYADVRGHHGKKWDFEPSKHYMGVSKKKQKTIVKKIEYIFPYISI